MAATTTTPKTKTAKQNETIKRNAYTTYSLACIMSLHYQQNRLQSISSLTAENKTVF